MEKTTKPGYKFDHVNGRIVITREFAKKANILGSNEYKTLQKLHKELSGYTVVFAAPHRKTSAKSHMTLARMVRYIEQQPDKENILADMEKVRYPEDCLNPAPFGVVKKWFFTRFPNYGQMTPIDSKGNIIMNNVAATR